MLKQTITSLALSTLLFGCGVTVWRQVKSSWNIPETAFVCVNGVPETLHDRIAEAINSWNKALGNWRHFKPVFDENISCAYLIHEVPNDLNQINGPIPNSPDAVAFATLGGREISLRKGYYEYDVGAIVLHEFGHVLGAQHVPNTTMDPTVLKIQKNVELCPDIYTVSQVAAWNKLNLETLSWCFN